MEGTQSGSSQSVARAAWCPGLTRTKHMPEQQSQGDAKLHQCTQRINVATAFKSPSSHRLWSNPKSLSGSSSRFTTTL